MHTHGDSNFLDVWMGRGGKGERKRKPNDDNRAEAKLGTGVSWDTIGALRINYLRLSFRTVCLKIVVTIVCRWRVLTRERY